VLVHFSHNKNFVLTPEDIRSGIDPQVKAFPDVSDTISLIIAEGDWVSIRVRHEGTNSDSLWGLPPAKKFINYSVMEMYRLKNNKIVKIYVVEDHF
jgi:predicted ester cyclase